MYVCNGMYECIYVCTCIYVCMYIMYVCMYVNTNVCMYVCVYACSEFKPHHSGQVKESLTYLSSPGYVGTH